MAPSPLDAIDRGILYHLQEDAHQSLTDIADALDAAVSTVRNRIEKLENEGVIKGYTVDVDYGRADVRHHYLFFCTVRVSGSHSSRTPEPSRASFASQLS